MYKNADTIGMSIIQTCTPIFQSISDAIQTNEHGLDRARVVHLVTGDGIPTNRASMRRLLHFCLHSPIFTAKILYALVVIICGSHVANLVVQVAIVGKVIAKPDVNDDLTAACSRWFKFLVRDYAEEYALSFKQYCFKRMSYLCVI